MFPRLMVVVDEPLMAFVAVEEPCHTAGGWLVLLAGHELFSVLFTRFGISVLSRQLVQQRRCADDFGIVQAAGSVVGVLPLAGLFHTVLVPALHSEGKILLGDLTALPS